MSTMSSFPARKGLADVSRPADGTSVKLSQKLSLPSPFLIVSSRSYNECLKTDQHMDRFQYEGYEISKSLYDLLAWGQDIAPVRGSVQYYKLTPSDLCLSNRARVDEVLGRIEPLGLKPCLPSDPFKIVEQTKLLHNGELEIFTIPNRHNLGSGCHLSVKLLTDGHLVIKLLGLCKPHKQDRVFIFRQDMA